MCSTIQGRGSVILMSVLGELKYFHVHNGSYWFGKFSFPMTVHPPKVALEGQRNFQNSKGWSLGAAGGEKKNKNKSDLLSLHVQWMGCSPVVYSEVHCIQTGLVLGKCTQDCMVLLFSSFEHKLESIILASLCLCFCTKILKREINTNIPFVGVMMIDKFY